MKCINLIPAYRRQAKACRTRAEHWLPVGVAYVGVLVFVCVICHRTWGVESNPLADELRQTKECIDGSKETVAELRTQLTASRWKLDTFRGVGQQPDWGVMLTLLADGLGNEVVLKSCQLNETIIPSIAASVPRAGTPNAATGGLTEKPDRMAFVLNVAGFGRSQTAVSMFVLRLERSGMFDNVRIVSTIREPFLNTKAIAFSLECRLEGTTGRKR